MFQVRNIVIQHSYTFLCDHHTKSVTMQIITIIYLTHSLCYTYNYYFIQVKVE